MTDLQAPDGALDPVSDDVEAPEADALEQARSANPAANPAAPPSSVRVPLEANEADAVEHEAPTGGASMRVPLEADEADAVEQSQIVEDPDDDYRR